MTPQEFVAKWKRAEIKERSGYQEHFIDLCKLVNSPTPVEADPKGEWFMFEAGANKMAGAESIGYGWADVWKRGFFAFEYKGKHANLEKAYEQLQQYRESLQNPPLLVVCDLERILIHTNFTNSVKRVYVLTFDDLITPQGLDLLRAVFYEPAKLRAAQTTEGVTKEAATEFAKLADLLRRYGAEPAEAAHFLIRILFCLFAEDVGLLEKDLIKKMVQAGRNKASAVTAQFKQLFAAMANGGYFGPVQILHFNGGLFNNDHALDLDGDSLDILVKISALDWSSIEPSIFGTLFERSLDPGKRSQLGAHYTSKDDILLIVEPVLMAPLQRRWATVKSQAQALAKVRDAQKGKAKQKTHDQLQKLLVGFGEEIAQTKVLDPACGSGNFLYIALRLLMDLQKEVILLSGDLRVGQFFPSVSPTQLFGIELNDYAYELAQITIWIGYIQWLKDNGFGFPSEPILKPLKNIQHMDAILAFDADGKPIEPEWPSADVIIGNPPFLGTAKLRSELGNSYTEALFSLYEDRLPANDLVCYWFEKGRFLIEKDRVKRVGFLATQGIRGGSNRAVLDRIKRTGDIFLAYSDREWILDGATVHVSIIGFDRGIEVMHELDGQIVTRINSDLTSNSDLTQAQKLSENKDISFLGTYKIGSFDIDNELAQKLIALPINPNGRTNQDVVKPWVNGLDITRRPRNMWIIDFGDMSENAASLYEGPFEYVRKTVKPERDQNNRERRKKYWWQHGETSPGMHLVLDPLSRFIGTASVSKHRLFVWLAHPTLPDHQIVVFARNDDYFLGILHSKIHELWARATGTQLREAESGFRYTPTSTFETFPFPWAPGQEPKKDPKVKAIAAAAKELVEQRDRWLNPADATEAELKKRTLTNLYNQRPTWLDLAHKKLDQAVFAAYGWPADLTDEQILERLLALNLERSKAA